MILSISALDPQHGGQHDYGVTVGISKSRAAIS
jgi:hypothetical protein